MNDQGAGGTRQWNIPLTRIFWSNDFSKSPRSVVDKNTTYVLTLTMCCPCPLAGVVVKTTTKVNSVLKQTVIHQVFQYTTK